MNSKKYFFLSLLFLVVNSSCEGFMGAERKLEKLETVEYVDLERFMGDWYVIANIPTFIEKGAVNAIESYKLDSKGRVKTTFTFKKDAPDGPQKTYNPTGFIYNEETNAEWRMQFLWPFKAPFLIIDLDEEYSYTVIGIPSRKYVWIMARDHKMADELYGNIISKLKNVGYDTSLIKKVPQDWD
tara:strand:- start:152 stop:703 length:552 start_codon:yes stop_codon:yes gene_type:complete